MRSGKKKCPYKEGDDVLIEMLNVRIPAKFMEEVWVVENGKRVLYYNLKTKSSRGDWLPYLIRPEDVSPLGNNPNMSFKIRRYKYGL